MAAPVDEATADRPTILYFGNDWAAENRTSSHHVARWLAKRYRVIYVESPGLRAPKGTGRDLRKLVSKVGLALRGPRPTPEGLQVQTLLQIPLHGSPLVRRANRELMLLTLKLLMRMQGVKKPITWFVVPHLASVVGHLDERMSVYYCIDDYAALPDVDVEAVRAMDEMLTRKASLVFVASATLLEAKRALNPNTHVSAHGVDFDHFVKAQDPKTEIPGDAANAAGPDHRLLRADRALDRARRWSGTWRPTSQLDVPDDRARRRDRQRGAAPAQHPLPRAAPVSSRCPRTARRSPPR